MDKNKLVGLYGKFVNEKASQSRIDNLLKDHFKYFNTHPDAVFSAAGRTELGGNHTDHNLGHVVAGSISLDTLAAVHANFDYTVNFVSEGYENIVIDISKLEKVNSEEGKTASLIRGIANAFVERNVSILGFSANVCSNVLKGSGLSSSASVEILIASIFNELFNEGRFSTTQLAIIGREAENNYFGKPCGLMDQIACANGGVVGIDFKNIDNPSITPINVNFENWGYSLVITDVRASHADLTPDYSAIPEEMRSVAAFFGQKHLANVNEKDFYSNIATLRKTLKNDRAILRAHHFFEEDKRAVKMTDALRNNDIEKYLNLVKESGKSSFEYLQNVYSPAKAKIQAISLALAVSEKTLGQNCVARVHGGGFAGTIQTYVPTEDVGTYIKTMEKIFGQGCSLCIAIRNLPAGKI